MYEIRYDLDQLESAGKFIWENNKYCSSWPRQCFSSDDVKEIILQDLRRIAEKNIASYHDRDKWVSYSGTGGYMFIFTSDDPYSIDVSIFVDPSVGKSSFRQVTEVHDK